MEDLTELADEKEPLLTAGTGSIYIQLEDKTDEHKSTSSTSINPKGLYVSKF